MRVENIPDVRSAMPQPKGDTMACPDKTFEMILVTNLLARITQKLVHLRTV
jgi:hypothetical protein